HQFGQLYIDHEGAVRSAFQTLLAECGQRADPSITKWDIVQYVYAILHHPEYRERYAANLRRELPRIPFVGATGAKAHHAIALDAVLKSDIFQDSDRIPTATEYRERYAANLRRELPRIPFVGATGAKAHHAIALDAGLKPGSSTESARVTTATEYRERYAANLRRELPRIPARSPSRP